MDAFKKVGYYENEGKQPLVVLGIDGTKEKLEAVDKGYFLGTVLNDSAGQARVMLELAYTLTSDNTLSPEFTLLDDNLSVCYIKKM